MIRQNPEDGSPRPDAEHRDNLRLYISVGSALATIPLAALAIREATVGDPTLALLLCLGLVVVFANLVLTRRTPFSLWPARSATLAILLLIFHGVYTDGNELKLIWPLVLPPILLFIYDRKEGLLWVTLLFLPCLTYVLFPEPWGASVTASGAFEFITAYLACCMFAFAFQGIYARNRAASEARAQALQREERRFKDFAEIGSDWLYELDAAHRFTYVSNNMVEQLEQSRSLLLGQPFEDFLRRHAQDHDGETERVAAALSAARSVPGARFALRVGNRVVNLNVNLHPMFDASGQVVGFRGVASDVSALVAQEQELREKERVLHRAQKMEAVGQLTSGLAHDFNNLLTVISGNLDLMSVEGADFHANVTSARQAADRAADLTAKLLAFARKQPLLPQDSQLGKHLETMRSLLRATLGEQVDLQIKTEPELWYCRVDIAQFESAVLNLAINARDAMPDGGRLTLSVSNEAFAGDEDLNPGNYVRVLVEDTGSGMSDAIQEHVFEPFFSTKPQGVGSGLGLSMVYGFVRQSQGDVRILRSDASGTAIALYFPFVVGVPLTTVDAALTPSVNQLSGRPRVLVLEDEASVRALLDTMLSAIGCQATTVATLAEGRAQLADHPYDLLISDVILAQGENGLQLVRDLRAEGSQLPILLISGYAEPIFDESFVPDDRTRLLSKPFGLADLTGAIDDVLHSDVSE